MNTIELVIGNKNYSSWSLRPWILLKNKGIQFEETRIPLYQEGSHEELLKHSESAKAPVLKYGDILVWDSLAICETIAELFPEKQCWPQPLPVVLNALRDAETARALQDNLPDVPIIDST